MSTTTVVAMVLILGFVWGGLAFILVTAIRKEREKRAPEPRAAPSRDSQRQQEEEDR